MDKEPEKKDYKPQLDSDQQLCTEVFETFRNFRDNRDRYFALMRNRTPLEYWNDSEMRFNNFKVKPSWKDEWQSNISDITTHAKVMAVTAYQVANPNKAVFSPRFRRDYLAKILSQAVQDIYDYTEEEVRNGELDLLMTALSAAKRGTVIGFEGYRKGKLFEGIDARFIALEDFYPANVSKFSMNEQYKGVWRSQMDKDEFDELYHNWYQYNKVQTRRQLQNQDVRFFNISQDLDMDKVEVLRLFDRLNNKFVVIANGILITNKGLKLSDRRQDGELGFWKTVFEPNEDFFYGRSLPDLMQDNQDSIDNLFENMFDRETISLLRPILVGGVNDIIDDYLYPGRMASVGDINQMKELAIDPPDLTAFRLLKEIKDRQNFISVDETSSGVATGRKTATEVERASEASQKLNSVFGIMIKDCIMQKAKLRAAIIQQYMIKSKKYRQFISENVKLLGENTTGTRLVRITDKLSPRNKYGFSAKLNAENKMIQGKSEIFEITPKDIKEFELNVKVKAPTTVEMSPALRRAYDIQWVMGARNNPQYDQSSVERIFTEAMDKDWEEVRVKEQGGQNMQTENQDMQLTPTLQSMINQPAE